MSIFGTVAGFCCALFFVGSVLAIAHKNILWLILWTPLAFMFGYVLVTGQDRDDEDDTE